MGCLAILAPLAGLASCSRKPVPPTPDITIVFILRML